MSDLFQLPKTVPLSTTGSLLSGAKLTFFQAGTSTLQTVYTDRAQTVPHTNPVVADGNGVFAPIYLDETLDYKVTLSTSADVELYTVDDFNESLTQTEIGKILFPQSDEEQAESVVPVEYIRTYGDIRRNGADPTGLTSSSSAIQDALDTSDVVYIPEGVFLYDTALDVPSDREIVGEGDFSILRAGANVSCLSIDGKSNVRLFNFTIDGQRATYTNTANNGIDSPANGTGCSNIEIDRVTVKDMAGAGIIFLAQTGSHSTDIKMFNVYVENVGAHGIVCQDYVDRVYLENPIVNGHGLLVANRPGVTLGRNAVDQRINGGHVYGASAALGTSAHGFSIDQCTNFVVEGIHAEDHVGFGLEIVGSNDGVVNGVLSKNGIRAGIVLVGGATVGTVANVAISNYVVKDNAAQGVYMHDGDGTLISKVAFSSGVVDTAATIGHQIDEACQDITFTSCQSHNCGRSGFWSNVSDRVIFTGCISKDNNTTSTAGHAGFQVNNSTGPERDYILANNIATGNNIADFTVLSGIDNDGAPYSPNAQTFTAADATPNITNSYIWRTADTTTYTDFDGAKGDGHEFVIKADHAATVTNNANIVTGTGGNVVLASGRAYKFVSVSGVWYMNTMSG